MSDWKCHNIVLFTRAVWTNNHSQNLFELFDWPPRHHAAPKVTKQHSLSCQIFVVSMSGLICSYPLMPWRKESVARNKYYTLGLLQMKIKLCSKQLSILFCPSNNFYKTLKNTSFMSRPLYYLNRSTKSRHKSPQRKTSIYYSLKEKAKGQIL